MKIRKQSSALFLLITAILLLNNACNSVTEEKSERDYSNGNFISELNAALTDAVIIDLFSPPVASRIYLYPNIAAYEVMRNTDLNSLSFARRLNGLNDTPVPDNEMDIDFTVAALTAFIKVGKELIYTEAGLISFESYKMDSLINTGISDEVLKSSISYGNTVADHILNWANDDSYNETRSAERYSLLKLEGTWLPTPPDYTPAMEPHWEDIRTFVISSADIFLPDSIEAFSKDPSSEFYKMNMEVYDAVNMVDSDQINMAKFWDDNPVVTEHVGHMMVKNKKMTPGGHWIYITSLAVKSYKTDMISAAQNFTITSIAIADAFISSFDAKYYFHTIRPVTFINDNISSDWQPVIQTPPFPEYPSAHSAISASAATVLTYIYSDNFAFTDSSELPFDLPIRSFHSFNHAAEEVALSRFYGGIHYTVSNVVGSKMGRQVGEAVIEKLMKNVPLASENQ